jgi:hypothetical protein
VTLGAVTASADGRADALGDLEKAHSAYVAHKYEDAETRLRTLLDAKTSSLKDPDNINDARMYLGAVLLAEKKNEEAAEIFEQLLRDKPDYQPDPLRVSLDAIDALIDARTRMRTQLAAILAEQVRRAEEEKAKVESERLRAASRLAMLEELARTEVVRERHSRWLALIPFGVGQFQNGQNTLGWVFLSVEAGLAVGSAIAAGEYLYCSGQRNHTFALGDKLAAADWNANAQQAAVVSDVFAGGMIAAAIVGVVQAQLAFVPEKVQTRTRTGPLPLSLGPVVGPGVLGVAGRF